MSTTPSTYPHPKTKIVATVGPASREESQLVGLIEAGVDVFRLNAAHGSIEEHDATVRTIRRLSQQMGRPVAVLLDLAGPKIRLGELVDGQVECRAGEAIRLVRGEKATGAGELVANYPRLIDELEPGKSVMLADGVVGLMVEEVTPDFASLRVMQTGLVRSRQGVNLPGARLSLPAMSEADRQYAHWAAQAGVDFIGLSFVRTPDEVLELKSLVRSLGSSARIIAKIEKQEALDRLPDIVAAADGLMVARGDLGVEIDLAVMPVKQKQIIALCNLEQKPVIVATQMLESMQHSRRPTRAEATDVANAILDGCDACMLSGETAIGEYPRETVETMNRIALATELYLRGRPCERAAMPSEFPEGLKRVTQAVVFGAGQIAQRAQRTVDRRGQSQRSDGLGLVEATRLRADHWRERPRRRAAADVSVLGRDPARRRAHGRQPALLAYLEDWGRRQGLLATGDQIVLVAGTGFPTQGHNMVMVHQVGA